MENLHISQLIPDMLVQQRHLPKTIMQELYCITANPRFVTLDLFIQYNYPQYNNDVDKDIIWNHSHSTQGTLQQLVYDYNHAKYCKNGN